MAGKGRVKEADTSSPVIRGICVATTPLRAVNLEDIGAVLVVEFFLALLELPGPVCLRSSSFPMYSIYIRDVLNWGLHVDRLGIAYLCIVSSRA